MNRLINILNTVESFIIIAALSIASIIYIVVC